MAQSTDFQWADDNVSSTSSITDKFMLPENLRPNLNAISDESIPVIDMALGDEHVLARKIADACQEFGFFQVVNHGVGKELCENVLDVITRFFELPHEDKAQLVTVDHMEDGKLFKYYANDIENQKKIPMWSEALFHTWHPDDTSFLLKLPKNPSDYRETIAEYTKRISPLMSRLLQLMSLGLGLNEDHLQRILGENQAYSAQANYYPACSNPEQTLGLRPHTDFKILTAILQEQGVAGLHVLRDESSDRWVAVNPIPGALVVNVADQLQVLSNDKYKSAIHRAVINKDNKRVSYALFYGPNENTYIEPIKELIGDEHPAKYRKYQFREFMEEFRNQEGQRRMVKDKFRI